MYLCSKEGTKYTSGYICIDIEDCSAALDEDEDKPLQNTHSQLTQHCWPLKQGAIPDSHDSPGSNRQFPHVEDGGDDVTLPIHGPPRKKATDARMARRRRKIPVSAAVLEIVGNFTLFLQ